MPWAAKSGEHRPDWRTPWVLFREFERRYAFGGRATFEPPPGYTGKVSSWAEPMALISFEAPLYLPAYAWRAPHAVGVDDLFAHEQQRGDAAPSVNGDAL
jgi:hypothetical protein